MAEPRRPATRLVVRPEQAGLRLDQYLAAATELSRRRARTLVTDGLVRRNGVDVRVLSRPVDLADVIDVALGGIELGVPETPQLPHLPLLLHDAWLAVADKPAGMLSQAAEERQPGELAADEALALTLAVTAGRPVFLRLIHRLDRVTSGTLVVARRREALPALDRIWRAGEAVRLYLAIVSGRPAWNGQVIDAPIARDASRTWRFRVHPGGRPARTVAHVLHREADTALVACRLLTGRTHQVRVHLAAAGHPVLGDRLYGGAAGASRPLLHAALVALPHPSGRGRVEVTAPLPSDFDNHLPPGLDLAAALGDLAHAGRGD